MNQSSLWQQEQNNSLPYAELCNALYEREVSALANGEYTSTTQLQARLKSLTYYVSRTAYRILQTDSPIEFDVQNATWSHKQSLKPPTQEQLPDTIRTWYQNNKVSLGLVIPVLADEDGYARIYLDSVDRVDHDNGRIRSNLFGWYNYSEGLSESSKQALFLKPNKKVMIAACCGHQWQSQMKANPLPLNLRELLLTCSINWKNLRKPIEG